MLLVYGPRSTDYDFGPGHPLTPRRFGPGIDLLQAVGAERAIAPEPAPDAELLWCHDAGYIEVVRRFSVDPYGFPDRGLGEGGDCPPFAGMHEASAAVAGGSLRAVEAILRGEVEHALHPGGGLHHAMAGRASGFCIYDDPALAIARARHEGLRVLYVDLDVHHGDGVEALHADDPGVLTFSIHETGRTLFPGTGEAADVGEGVAAGTVVNVPLPPLAGDDGWLPAVESLLPDLAAAFGPDLIVSQHGADSHAWDPLAHLNVTTTAHGAAARLVDRLAHAHAGGRWLATGGGGYDAYRVVPRTWALTWLAGAHREVPAETPRTWRERWADEAARYGQSPLPAAFDDASNAGIHVVAGQLAAEARGREIAAAVRRVHVPRLVREARDRGWLANGSTPASSSTPTGGSTPTVAADVDAGAWSRLTLATRVLAPADQVLAHALVAAALADGARVSVALDGDLVVGAVVSHRPDAAAAHAILALGIAPDRRRAGLAGALVRAHLAVLDREGGPVEAVITLAERDVVEPLEHRLRAGIARRLLEGAGFVVEPADGPVRAIDPAAIGGSRAPGGSPD